jgi:hypothetical protein
MDMRKKKIEHPVNSPIYSYYRALYLSFYASRLYIDVVKRWQGLGMRYLFIAIVIGAIPLSSRIIIEFNQFFEEQILLPVKALPTLAIKNGNFLFNKPMPYLIKNKKGQVISIVDTSGAINKINDTYPQLKVLLTKNEIFFRPPSFKQFLNVTTSSTGNRIYSHVFSKTINGTFEGEHWIETSGISKLNTLVIMLIVPLVTIFYWAIFSILILFISTLWQLCSDVLLGIKLKFKESCRLLTVSSTPLIAFFFLIRTSNIVFQGLGFIYFILLIGYFFYAVLSVKREQALRATKEI